MLTKIAIGLYGLYLTNLVRYRENQMRTTTTAFRSFGRFNVGLVAVACLAVVTSSCGGSDPADSSAGPVTLRLGYLPNVTHASAIVGVEQGLFATALGTDRLETSTFTAGPEAVTALLSGAIDATYIGPNPSINAFKQSKGAIRIISGATSGGAQLVVAPGITSPEQLRGKKLATPQLGGTQDVALRWWLREQGLATDTNGGGDVSIQPQENARTLEAFRAGAISGAWVPEPWATRLVGEGGGTVLVDEASLWPRGQFVTTQLIVRKDFLDRHPDTVTRLLRGQIDANSSIAKDPARAQQSVISGIKKTTQKELTSILVVSAWNHLTFSNDPVASSLQASAEHAKTLGLPTTTDLDGIFDLAPLNKLLTATGQTTVPAP